MTQTDIEVLEFFYQMKKEPSLARIEQVAKPVHVSRPQLPTTEYRSLDDMNPGSGGGGGSMRGFAGNDK